MPYPYTDQDEYRDDDDVDCEVYADESDYDESDDDYIWRGYLRQIGFNNW